MQFKIFLLLNLSSSFERERATRCLLWHEKPSCDLLSLTKFIQCEDCCLNSSSLRTVVLARLAYARFMLAMIYDVLVGEASSRW